ncbi:pyridoxamine 5'-phosphate oxidase family protein [Angustibacter sp. McL0619]|uniref:pyridoxamine 5'-phosphate oxidase family protein n=1 Tax=Angustibacter sp. McL0619 TaxID=3415676 RepID=UPI003CE72611
MDTQAAPKVEELREHESWQLVRGTAVGRLAVIVDARPEIFPVNHIVNHAEIVFRSAPGTKLSGADGSLVAFEVDGVDLDSGLAWSVVAKGRAHVIRKLQEVVDTFGMELTSWQSGEKPIFVRIQVDEITGRRFTPTWRRPQVTGDGTREPGADVGSAP